MAARMDKTSTRKITKSNYRRKSDEALFQFTNLLNHLLDKTIQRLKLSLCVSNAVNFDEFLTICPFDYKTALTLEKYRDSQKELKAKLMDNKSFYNLKDDKCMFKYTLILKTMLSSLPVDDENHLLDNYGLAENMELIDELGSLLRLMVGITKEFLHRDYFNVKEVNNAELGSKVQLLEEEFEAIQAEGNIEFIALSSNVETATSQLNSIEADLNCRCKERLKKREDKIDFIFNETKSKIEEFNKQTETFCEKIGCKRMTNVEKETELRKRNKKVDVAVEEMVNMYKKEICNREIMRDDVYKSEMKTKDHLETFLLMYEDLEKEYTNVMLRREESRRENLRSKAATIIQKHWIVHMKDVKRKSPAKIKKSKKKKLRKK